jgi:murein DD-endopeptidase MepM/ murein hydrolase activator NlpD
MRRPSLALSLIIIFLAGCGQTADGGPQITDHRPSPTVNDQTSTVSSQLPTQSPTPLAPTPTPTPLPCNPLTGYCVEDGYFFLDRPISLPGTITIDQGYPYGSTERGTREPHHGVEFYNASGTPVLAAADGLVVVAGNDSGTVYGPQPNFYGNLIVLEHHFQGIDQPVFTLYGHLSKVDVKTGQTVRSGDKIGEVGSTGFAIGSHLHFEVRLGKNDYDSNRNPVLWLKPLTGLDGSSFGVIAGRLVDAQGKLIHATDVNIQYFPDLNGPQAAAYQVETYAPEQSPVNGDDDWNENFTMGDLPAGNYRISLMWGGKVYDHWIVVMPGNVTFVVFQIDQ